MQVLGIPGKEKEAINKQEYVEKALTLLHNTKIEYNNMTEQLINEYELFKIQKANDLNKIMMKFTTLQVGKYE